MNGLNEAISKIGVVPVIKLSNPDRDAAALAKALCAGGIPVAEVTFRAAGADRAIRLMKEAQPADFDWDAIFEGVDWFHFTGITPALGPNVVEICRETCQAAKARNVKISCDLNYRGKLWSREEARAAMTDLCQYVDVCISNEEDAKDVFGIESEATDITAGELNKEGYKSVAKQLADRFHFEKVAITLRESKSAFDNDWSAMLYDVASDEYCFSKLYHLHIIDRIGGGDGSGRVQR